MMLLNLFFTASFALEASPVGSKSAFLKQPIKVSALRPQFASYIGTNDRSPDIVIHFGYRPETLSSLRRPLDRVIVE